MSAMTRGFADKEHWVITNVEHFRPLGKGTWPSEDTYYTVPQDSVFVIGDNRDNSADGRKWGSVPRGFIRGKALFVMWSMYTKENSWQPIFRFSRFGTWSVMPDADFYNLSTGDLAQMVERSLSMREALGSMPRFSIFPVAISSPIFTKRR